MLERFKQKEYYYGFYDEIRDSAAWKDNESIIRNFKTAVTNADAKVRGWGFLTTFLSLFAAFLTTVFGAISSRVNEDNMETIANLNLAETIVGAAFTLLAGLAIILRDQAKKDLNAEIEQAFNDNAHFKYFNEQPAFLNNANYENENEQAKEIVKGRLGLLSSN